MLQLVFDRRATVLRGEGAECLVVVERALESHDVVLDLRERLLIVDAILFELGFVGLKLSERFDEPAFAIEHIELELRVAQLDEGLAFGDGVARLREDAFDPAAFERVEIHRIHRDDVGSQRNEVVELRPLHFGDGQLVGLHSQRALG